MTRSPGPVFPGVQYLGPGFSRSPDILRRKGGYSRKSLEKIESHPLTGKDCPGFSLDNSNDIAIHYCFPIPFPFVVLHVIIKSLENLPCITMTRNDSLRFGDDKRL